MSDNGDKRPSTYRAVVLRGPENFAEWELSVGSALLAHGLLDCITTTTSPSATTAAKEVKRGGKAFPLIIQSLSSVVQQSLSTAARSVTAPNPSLLWTEIKSQYSAPVVQDKLLSYKTCGQLQLQKVTTQLLTWLEFALRTPKSIQKV